VHKKLKKTEPECWVWWYTPVIPALEKLRQEDLKFEVSLGYIVISCLKKKKKRKKKKTKTTPHPITPKPKTNNPPQVHNAIITPNGKPIL
jgi:hypothetical protein